MGTAVIPIAAVIFSKFDHLANKQAYKKNFFISMVQIKFGQKLLSHFFEISTFWYQLGDYFKNVDCSCWEMGELKVFYSYILQLITIEGEKAS